MATEKTRILIVEDEAVLAQSLRRTLNFMGYTVTGIVMQGSEVLTAVAQAAPHLILMDIRLQGDVDGIAAAQQVRDTYRIPVIYLTGYADERTLERAKATEPFGYLLKPFESQVLRSTIEMALHKHKLERQLEDSESRLRQIIEQTPYPIQVCTPDGVVLLVNQAFLSIFDVQSVDEIMPLPHYFPVDFQEHYQLSAALERVHAGEVIVRPDLLLPLPIGKTECEITMFPVYTRDGDLSQVVTLIKDISHQKQTERMLRQRNRELTALNNTNQALTSSLDLAQVLELVMQETKILLGAEGASVLLYHAAQEELEFAAVAGPGAAQLRGTRMPARVGIAGEAFSTQQPILLSDAQQDPRFYGRIDALTGLVTRSLIAVPLRFKDQIIGIIEAINWGDYAFTEHDLDLLGILAGAAATAIENARLYMAEREQRQLVEQAHAQLVHSEKLAATGRLAATLAHEINNPLQTIHTSLEMLLMFPTSAEQQREYLQMADEEVQRLMQLVSRTLEFAHQPRQQQQAIHVNSVVEHVLALTSKYLQHRHILVKSELLPALPPILAQPDALSQVFLNLILNAVEAMPGGGVLTVRTAIQEEQVYISFSDTGRGIAPEHLPHIFEPFFTTKEKGTGMGLSVSYDLVQQQHGTITVETAIGQGTTFTVSFAGLAAEYVEPTPDR